VEVYGGGDVDACALESLNVGCGFEYEFNTSSAYQVKPLATIR
jgi:hypothetical protein